MVSRMLIFTLFVGVAYAATALSKLPPKPQEFADKEGCYIEQVNDVVPFGTELSPLGICLRIECGHKFIHYASCGVVSSDDPKCYKSDYDYSKPHPDCCPRIKCDDDNNIV